MYERTFYVWVIILIVEIVFPLLAGLFSFRIPKKPNGEPITKQEESRIIIYAKWIFEPPITLIVLAIFSTVSATFFQLWYISTTNQDTFVYVAVSIAIVFMTIMSVFILFCIYIFILFIKSHFTEKRYALLYDRKPYNIAIMFQ